MSKRLAWIQAAVLLGGTLFAWYTTVKNFVRFYHFEGTLFKIHNCVIPNPVTEPCFYGALAFLVALLWMVYIVRRNIVHHIRYLFWFLAAGTAFAWINVTREVVAFYTARGTPVLGCSATPILNPFLTPCFTGASIFLLSLLLAAVQYNHIMKQKMSVQ